MNINPRNTKDNISKHMLADGMSQIIDLEKSHGSWLVDGRDNRQYLDLFSMFASLSVGYNHPYILKFFGQFIMKPSLLVLNSFK